MTIWSKAALFIFAASFWSIGVDEVRAANADQNNRPRTRYVYGYSPYESHYGPIEAQYELDGWMTNHPAVRGLDYGYGIGYFFGLGPAHHYSHGIRAWRGSDR